MRKISFVSILLVLVSFGAGAEVYLTTDRSCYVAGNDILCSAFSTTTDAVAYVELRSTDGLVQSGKILLNSGRGAGQLRIPLTSPTGNYRLIAYTAADKLVDGFDYYAHSARLSIFNTVSTARVAGGVEFVDEYTFSDGFVPVQKGLRLDVGESITVTNDSETDITFSLSVFREDGIAAPEERLISGWRGTVGAEAGVELDGETVYARLSGPDASSVAADEYVNAMISVPGLKTDVYTSKVGRDGTFSFHTSNVFGDRDVVCTLLNMDEGTQCHFELDSPFVLPDTPSAPKLKLSRSLAPALERRGEFMRAGQKASADTLYETLPFRKEHFFLENECDSYILDDYNRFPTMEEEFVEIVKCVRARRDRKTGYEITVLLEDNVRWSVPVWGVALTMVDGVPVLDHDRIMEYDPAIVKSIDVYPYTYNLGDMSFGGVINFVTFKGNMPMVTFDDNVRIYDFKGASYPMNRDGNETLIWRPLLKLSPGEAVSFDCSRAVAGQLYNIVTEGVGTDGSPVFARMSFSR